MECEHKDNLECECSGPVTSQNSRTAYHFTGEPNSPEDPNRNLHLCEAHAKLHHEYWDDMWATVGWY